MTIEEFKEKHNKIIGHLMVHDFDMKDVSESKENYNGVYMIYDPNDNNKVIYIGSSYAPDRSIGKRLTDYIYKGRSSNTLNKALVAKFPSKYKKGDDAIEYIKTLKCLAYEWFDLEYYLISTVPDILNCNGK